MKIQIIESNHMDYSSARVQFMLGLLLILGCTLLLGNSISSILSGLNLKLLIDASTSIIMGLLFFEIANRYSNKLQATAAIWASFVWFFLTIESNSLSSSLNGLVTFAAVLPVFLYLRYLLLEETKYLWYFYLALFLSLSCGLASFISSLSGVVLAVIFLPRKYFSNPTTSYLTVCSSVYSSEPPLRSQFSSQSKSWPLFVTLCIALAICYCSWFFSKNYAFSEMPNLSSFNKIEWLGFLLLLLVRLLIGKIFAAPILFCIFWTAINLLPHPELQFFNKLGEANLFAVPLTYLIVLASLPVFDTLSKKHSLILTFVGSVLMSVFCFGKGVSSWNSIHLISQTEKMYESQKLTPINYEGDNKLCLRSKDLNPQLISGSGKLTDVSALNWFTQDAQNSTCWSEKTETYLNLSAGPTRRMPKGATKTISDNGYGLKNGVEIKLASVKINPREANNVKITLAFPLQSNTRVNWIWKGCNAKDFYSIPLEVIDNKILRVNLKNEFHWLSNESIEQIGISIPQGSSSLAIEKIEL
ncbi:MAG: hypothetical protein IPG59_16625 [Candidatus Melainabacteria bacterium]|nr:MAG: hypothetical protein IPG59_16625 [Candidatus Melainabacteria bacterium]